MDVNQLKGLINFLPQEMRGKAGQVLTKALEMVDPSKIKTKEDAIQALQSVKNSVGLPPDLMNRVNNYLNNPLAGIMLSSLGIDKSEFKNGLQSIIQPDNSSALTSNSSLLQGIDQL